MPTKKNENTEQGSLVVEEDGFGAGVEDNATNQNGDGPGDVVEHEPTAESQETATTDADGKNSDTNNDAENGDAGSKAPDPPQSDKKANDNFRETKTIPVCKDCFVYMKATSKSAKSATRYYKCEGCGSTDKTYEHGLALKEPVFCIKACCTTEIKPGKRKRVAMKFLSEKTQKVATGQLWFECPECQDQQTRTSNSIRRVEEMIQQRNDVIQRRSN